jgi:predicted 3-demethylubiquinone-9 3-methyltransferase (glyoxalase superfamily)
MQKITPFLWFNGEAEAAAKFYTSIFKKSKILGVAGYGEGAEKFAGKPKGSVMTVQFQLDGQRFVALNGGPQFKINEAISFVVRCKTQKKIDYYWIKLSASGKEVQCGWLQDKFGVSWQIVPAELDRWVSSKHPQKSQRVMQALLKMVKLDLKKLERAYAGKK